MALHKRIIPTEEEELKVQQAKDVSLWIYNDTNNSLIIDWKRTEKKNKTPMERLELPVIVDLNNLPLEPAYYFRKRVRLQIDEYYKATDESTVMSTLHFIHKGETYPFVANLKFTYHPWIELDAEQRVFPFGLVTESIRYDEEKKQCGLVLYVVEQYQEFVPFPKLDDLRTKIDLFRPAYEDDD